MAGTSVYNVSPDVLFWARTSMGYTIDDTARKIGVTSDKVESWEKGESKPTYRQLENLAERVYKRPVAILFLPAPPQEEPLNKDFRNLSNAEVEHLSPVVRLALRKAKRYQLILEEVLANEELPKIHSFKIGKSDPYSAAIKFRKFLNLNISDQQSWNHDDAFNKFKNKLEEVGVFVFQLPLPMEEARAFCITGKYPIIVLSNDDAKNGRIFSLLHETCHILFNLNDIFKDTASGILNEEYENIEAFCNEFASSFLVPNEYFTRELESLPSKSVHPEREIKDLAKLFNVSREVIARKFLAIQRISEPAFWTMKRQWDAIARAAKLQDKERMKNEVSGIAQDKKLLHEKGKPYVKSVVNAYDRGKISAADLSNYLEVKLEHIPKIKTALLR